MKGAAIFLALMLGVVVSYPHSIKNQSNDLLTFNTVSKSHKLGIYNGNSTTMNTHRYLTSILKSGSFRCAGVIVSASWIVTLADCVESLTASEITVVASSTDGLTGKSYSVSQIVVHPDYGTTTLDYDFACVQISSKFYYGARRAHKLPTAELAANASIMVAGYGCIDSACSERALRKASMVWLPKDTCSTTYAKYDMTWERLGCIDNPDGATLCKGDFGDPVITGQVFYGMFASALSKGFCTASASPVIVTDVYPVADWVRNVTGAT